MKIKFFTILLYFFSIYLSAAFADTLVPQLPEKFTRAPVPCSPGSIIDFETISNGTILDSRTPVDKEEITDSINNFFWQQYGIKFTAGPGDAALIGKVGSPRTGWGHGDGNDIMADATGRNIVDTYFLATRYHFTPTPQLKIEYRNLVSSASAGIIDIDGNERWIVTAYDQSMNALESRTLVYSSTGAGSGKIAFWQFSRAQKDIKYIILDGTKGTSVLGLGFDYFSPSTVCVPF